MRWVLPAEPKPLGWEKQVSDEKLATGERMLQKNPKQFGLEGPVVPPLPFIQCASWFSLMSSGP
jgi:hypothetical protein